MLLDIFQILFYNSFYNKTTTIEFVIFAIKRFAMMLIEMFQAILFLMVSDVTINSII